MKILLRTRKLLTDGLVCDSPHIWFSREIKACTTLLGMHCTMGAFHNSEKPEVH